MPDTRSGVPLSRYQIEPLTRNHDRSRFRCGKEPLDRFLQTQVFDWIGRDLARPFVLVATDDPARVLGYYTLSVTRIEAVDLPLNIAKRFPHTAEIGAILLGKLAIDQTRQRDGLGRDMLLHALGRCLDIARQAAVYSVVVDAIDAGAASFYAHFGFVPFPDQPLRLYLPLKTHAAQLAAL